MADDGLITVASNAPVGETIDRLVATVTATGLRVFARIDHAAGAAEVGMELRPTEVVLFGHPHGGTPLMQDRQTAGIDLPLKALGWEDAGGLVWLNTDDPSFIARRHGLGDRSQAAVAALTEALRRVTGSPPAVERDLDGVFPIPVMLWAARIERRKDAGSVHTGLVWARPRT